MRIVWLRLLRMMPRTFRRPWLFWNVCLISQTCRQRRRLRWVTSWGLILQRRDDPAEAREVFTLTAADFLLGPDQMEDLGPLGQYWLSRTVLELGAILALEGETEEARRLYRKMIAFNLPGRTIAAERLETSSVN